MSTIAVYACTNQPNTEKDQPQSAFLLSDISNKASCVFLTSDSKNNAVISWCEQDSTDTKYAFLAYLNPATQTFEQAVPLPIEQNTSLHEEGMPKIAIKEDGTIVAIYETSTPAEGMQWGLGDIRYIQSFDRGKTWTPPHSISPEVKKGLSASFSGIACLSDGEVGATWLGSNIDKSINGRPVFFAKTAANKGFDAPVLITRQACECCRTALSSDAKGNINIVYRGVTDDNIRDISLSISADKGKTFNTPKTIGINNWVIDGCPHNGPCVVSNNEAIYATWYSGDAKKGVYFAAIDDAGKTQKRIRINANGKFTQIALMADNTKIIVYNEISQTTPDSFYSKIVLNKMTGDKIFVENVTRNNAKAYYPVLTPVGQHKIVVAWSESDQIFYRLLDVRKINGKEILPFALPKYNASASPEACCNDEGDPVCGMHKYPSDGKAAQNKKSNCAICLPRNKSTQALNHPKTKLL